MGFLDIFELRVQNLVVVEKFLGFFHAEVDGAHFVRPERFEFGHERIDESFERLGVWMRAGFCHNGQGRCAGQSLTDPSCLDDAVFIVGKQFVEGGLEAEPPRAKNAV
ncbi:MAG: hypothetical protein BWY17_05123 [Deltaproteobacteria bacterium ADurb.Bin207]|nr:MAG: hypothetical protein BWY17_05123 [Deltaproteobacteria bacterium ADurb.Bin207]